MRADGCYSVVDQHERLYDIFDSEEAAFAHIAVLYGLSTEAADAAADAASYDPIADCSRLDVAARAPLAALAPHEAHESVRAAGAYTPFGERSELDTLNDQPDMADQQQIAAPPVAVPSTPPKQKRDYYAAKLAKLDDAQLAAEAAKLRNCARSRQHAGAEWVKRNQQTLQAEQNRRQATPLEMPARPLTRSHSSQRSKRHDVPARTVGTQTMFDISTSGSRSIANAVRAVAQ